MSNRDLDIQGGFTVPLVADDPGGQLNLFPGYSTGGGRAVVSIKKSTVGSVGSAVANTFVDGLMVGCLKILVNNVATPIVHCTVANNTVSGYIIRYVAQSTDGVNVQIEVGEQLFTIMNKAGVYTTGVTEVKSANAHTAGSISVVFTLTDAVDINVKVNGSVTPSTGYPRILFSVENLGSQAISLY